MLFQNVKYAFLGIPLLKVSVKYSDVILMGLIELILSLLKRFYLFRFFETQCSRLRGPQPTMLREESDGWQDTALTIFSLNNVSFT